MVADVSADPMTEGTVTLSRVRGALKQKRNEKEKLGRDSPRENQDKGGNTYTETSGGLLTSLRKRLALAAASSCLVAAAAPLSFFILPPGALGPA